MTYQIIIEPTAERGIREAFRWIAGSRSPAAAAKWYNAVDRAIRTLAKHPARCPVAAESERFPEELRELLHGRKRQRYRIVFTIRQDAVHVLYVRHGAQEEIEGP